jgi:hypothetical protein
MSKEILKAMYSGDLHIGDLTIPCAVLENGTRVLSQRGFAKSLGAAKPSAIDRRGAGNLPAFMSAKNLKPFIDEELAAAAAPIPYIPQTGGSALGVDASIFPKICDVWLKARDADVLFERQKHLAKQAEIIMRGMAHIGIIALVDEATGYQYARAREALEKILELYIAKELFKWVKTFPDEFYQQLFRLHGWQKNIPFKVKRPAFVGKLTNDLVYERLAPGVLEELKRLNPRTEKGTREYRHHQWLTREVGHPRLREHLWAVVSLMRAAANWNEFKRMLNRALPKYGDLPLIEYGERQAQEREAQKAQED